TNFVTLTADLYTPNVAKFRILRLSQNRHEMCGLLLVRCFLVRCFVDLAWPGALPMSEWIVTRDSLDPMALHRSHTAPIQDHIDAHIAIDGAIDDLFGIDRAPRCRRTETGEKR